MCYVRGLKCTASLQTVSVGVHFHSFLFFGNASLLGCTGWETHQQLEASINDLVVYNGVEHGFCLQGSMPCDSSFGNADVYNETSDFILLQTKKIQHTVSEI